MCNDLTRLTIVRAERDKDTSELGCHENQYLCTKLMLKFRKRNVTCFSSVTGDASSFGPEGAGYAFKCSSAPQNYVKKRLKPPTHDKLQNHFALAVLWPNYVLGFGALRCAQSSNNFNFDLVAADLSKAQPVR